MVTDKLIMCNISCVMNHDEQTDSLIIFRQLLD